VLAGMQDYCRQPVHEAAVNPVPQRSSGSGQEGTGHPLLMPSCAYLPLMPRFQVVVSLCKITQTNKTKQKNKLSLLASNVHVELAILSEPARHELHDIFTMMSIMDYASSHVCTANVMGMIASLEGA